MNVIYKSNSLTSKEIVTVTIEGQIYLDGGVMDIRKDNLMQMTKESYREKIVEMIGQIEDIGTLQYLHRFIELFLEKWG